MDDADTPLPPRGEAPWQALPERARLVCVLHGIGRASIVGGALTLPFALVVLRQMLDVDTAASFAIAIAVMGTLVVLVGTWLGRRLHRRLRWQADAGGLTVRRGHTWLRETHVPADRVQHLDLTRGPLQRRRQLATLVLHTAGTRMSPVTLPHLDDADAEALRDALSRQHAADAHDD